MKMHRFTPNPWLCLLLFVFTSCTEQTLFRRLSSEQTGITFNNTITESDTLNPVDVTNIYNGGGVGVGDFNNDGLPDLYFAGNQVANKLYLNKGGLQFADVTDKAGVEGRGRWCRGVTVVDINNDGLQDIYVAVTLTPNPEARRNLLYVNQGLDADKQPRFTEMAAAYGLDDPSHSTHAAFFDYDNDGDLDMYLVVNEVNKRDNPAAFRPKMYKGESPSTGKLFRNDWNDSLRHPFFTDVTFAAGTTIEGYGHSVSIADFNLDGWKDIFVANDFLTNDLLYINNHDGTFTDKAASYFKHTSSNGMGQDVIDINNDGLSDVVELDMNPEDNFRKKMMMNANNYGMYQNSDYFGYQYQYVRNTIQVNQGPRVLGNDSLGDPVFSDIGFFSGVSETDWSWTPLVQDFDNDGYRDIVVTNGFPKDVTDHDFAAYATVSSKVASRQDLLAEIPQVKVHNYAFRNNGNLSFSNQTDNWGLGQPSFSNGAAQVDLDNDGDMDFVVNNINDEAFVYENTLSKDEVRSLTLQLKGDAKNPQGFGAWIDLYYPGGKQRYEQSPYRGYLSTIDARPHFGLGKAERLDSLVIRWPNGKMQVLRNVPAGKMLELDIRNAQTPYNWTTPVQAAGALFTNITQAAGIDYVQREQEFIDFNFQKLLPHKLSEYGPALAAGDVDGNGTDDIVVGGSFGYSPELLLQDAAGRFTRKPIFADSTAKQWEDMGIALFDAEGDGDLDLYTASGGYEAEPGSPAYQDHFYVNDGKGNFSPDAAALPRNTASKSAVRVADYDRDGDLDVLVTGRVVPRQYPKPASGVLLRNDSQQGKVRFTDVTKTVAPQLTDAGLVCDALWSDYDNDGWPDLLLASEWSALKLLQNDKGVFRDRSAEAGLSEYTGWWNSLVPADFDQDGDMDYVAANLGQNSFYRASKEHPIRIYGKDFNNDGAYDAVPTVYLPASHHNPEKKEFPAHVKDDLAKQMIQFRLKFTDYRSYAAATFEQMFTPEEMKGVLKLEASWLQHSLLRNDGKGRFTMTALPVAAQVACINGMDVADYDGDGKLDLLAIGNDYGTEPIVGRYDACNGLLLKGDGAGGFAALSMQQSGFFVPGNARALAKLRSRGGGLLTAASQNRGPLQLFRSNRRQRLLPLQPSDVRAAVTLAGGKVQLFDLNYGASFLSQSGRFLPLPAGVVQVMVTNSKGQTRTEKIEP